MILVCIALTSITQLLSFFRLSTSCIARLIERGDKPRILNAAEIDVNYRAAMDDSGSINTTSQNQAGAVHKTNFWNKNPDTGNTYVYDLFGLKPPKDEGLAFGQSMPGIMNLYLANDAQPFNHFDSDKQWFAADGVMSSYFSVIQLFTIKCCNQANVYFL